MPTNCLYDSPEVVTSFTCKDKLIEEIQFFDKETGNLHSNILIDKKAILSSEKVSLSKPTVFNNYLYFLADKTLLNQLYIYDFEKQTLRKLTSLRYGVDDLFVSDNRLIVVSHYLNENENLYKQLTKKKIEELNFSLKHDGKIITSLNQYNENGYTPFKTLYYSFNKRLSRLNTLPSVNKKEFTYPALTLNNPDNKDTICIINNKLTTNALSYFFENGFNINCVTDLSDYKDDQYLFLFENDVMTNLAQLKTRNKVVCFNTHSDDAISLGLTNKPIILSKDSLVESWLEIASHSPIKNIDKINSDLLLVGLQFGYNHPLEETELLYSGLKDRKKDLSVTMLVIPEATDDFFIKGNMKKQQRSYDAIISWLKEVK